MVQLHLFLLVRKKTGQHENGQLDLFRCFVVDVKQDVFQKFMKKLFSFFWFLLFHFLS